MGKIITKILLCTCLILLGGAVWLGHQNKALREDNDRLTNNQEALLGELSAYSDMNGADQVSVQVLELTKSELQKSCSDLAKKIEDLNVKLKRVEAVSQTSTTTTVNILAAVRDSSIIQGDSLHKVQAIDWSDPWVNVNGYMDSDSLHLNVLSADTLLQVVHKIPKRFLFFKYGCKAINQDIVSSNPHTKIVYNRYIDVK